MSAIDPLDLLERIHRDVAMLRDLTGDALVVTIAPAAEPAMKPPPVEGAATAARSRGAENERKVLAVLADGPARQADIADRVGIGRDTGVAVLCRLEAAGKVERVGAARAPGAEARGRPSPVWRLADSPERDPEWLPEAHETLQERPPPPAKSAAAQLAQARTDENVGLVVAALEDGPRTVPELAEVVGISSPRVRAALIRARRRVEMRGGERDGSNLWQRVPLPHEQEDVTISQTNGHVAEVHVLERLRRGSYSLNELAILLGCRAVDVAGVVSRLERGGRVLRVADGKYQLVEARAA